MPLFSGTRLGPYEVLSLLGAGGMGEVYRAREPQLARDVAIAWKRATAARIHTSICGVFQLIKRADPVEFWYHGN